MIEHKIKTWICEDCGYIQDFDPTDKAEWDKHFLGMDNKQCPSCKTGKLKKVTDPTKKVTIRSLEDSDINALDLTEQEKNILKAQRDESLSNIQNKIEI